MPIGVIQQPQEDTEKVESDNKPLQLGLSLFKCNTQKCFCYFKISYKFSTCRLQNFSAVRAQVQLCIEMQPNA